MGGGGEARRFDAAGAHAADLLRCDEAAFFEDMQVLNDRGQGDVERLGQLRDRDRPVTEPLHDRPARGVAEGVEDAVDIGFLARH